jgi:hypothetical protein
MKRILFATLIALTIGLPGLALAVPGTVTFTGRLRTSAGPVTDKVTIRFRLLESPAGEEHVWTETHSDLQPKDGMVFAELGSIRSLDGDDVFDGDPLWLEVTVDNEILTPRLPITSVPYAIRAGIASTAETLGGLAPDDVQTRLTAGSGISINGDVVSVDGSGCAAGNVWKYDGAGFRCQPDEVGRVTAGAGIAVTGSEVGLASCPAGQVWKSTGTSWACQSDDAPRYSAGTAIAIGAGNAVSLSSSGCVAGEAWVFDGQSFECVPVGYSAGAGTTVNPSDRTISIDDRVVPRKDGAANQAFDDTTLYLDYANDRVGIGTSSPTSALSVTGDVSARRYVYSSPRARTLFLGADTFAWHPYPREATARTWWYGPGYGYMDSSAGVPALSFVTLSATVALPDGATITELSCQFYDNSSSSNVNTIMSLYRRGFAEVSGSEVARVDALPTSGASPSIRTLVSTAIHDPRVDARGATYYIQGSFRPDPAYGVELRFYGCGVRYTVSEPD